MDLNSRRERAGGRLAALAPLITAGTAEHDPQRQILGRLASVLADAPAELASPLRLAVAGAIKAGKSTLVNALLGLSDQVAFVDELEATFRVNEFRHGPKRRVEAKFVDAAGVTISREVPFAELAGLTARDAGREEELRQLRRVVVELPVELLRTLHLVDTPGLFSVYGTDSAAALRELGVGADDRDRADPADVVLYLLQTEKVLDGDGRALREFLGGDVRAGAARSVGVLSRCDDYWPPSTDDDLPTFDPIAFAAQRARGKLDDPQLRELFYAIVPVSARVAEGACLLEPEAFEWLATLAAVRPGALAEALKYEVQFENGKVSFGLPSAARSTLLRRLGPWGIVRAAHHLRTGLTEEQTREQLGRDSGVAGLRELVLSHVGASAYLLKLDKLLDNVRRHLDAAQALPGGAADPRVRLVRGAVEEISDGETGFDALRVRRLLWRTERPGIDADALARVLRITEPGASVAERLGAARGTDAALLVPLARDDVAFWRRRAGMSAFRQDDEVRAAVRRLEVIAQDLLDRASAAARLRHEAEELLR